MLRKNHILIFFCTLLLSVNSVFAQRDSIGKAYALIQDQDMAVETRVKQAREAIDKFILNAQSEKDPCAWFVRGYIYKEWYKTFDSKNKKATSRLDAVAFLKKALELDTSNGKPFSYTATFMYTGKVATISLDFDQKAIKNILKYFGSTFYNDAGSLLDKTNYPTAI